MTSPIIEGFALFKKACAIIIEEFGLEERIWSKKVSSQFGVYKFLVFRKTLAHSSNCHIFGCANRDFNHAESTGDVQEKQARSHEQAFAENKKLVNPKFGAHIF
jgi:hypothetical protein